MNTIHRNNGLRNVLKNWKGEDCDKESDSEDAPTTTVGIYHCYKSLSILVSSYEQGSPLSALRFRRGQFGCVCRELQEVYELKMHLSGPKDSLNEMDYITWVIGKDKALGKLKNLEIDHPVLLLPLLSDSGCAKYGNKCCYTAVTDRCTKLTGSGRFVQY